MYKISANIVCKNERYWIKESILSIVDLIDEIIYVDDLSTDGSLEIVKELAEKYSNIKIYEFLDHQKKNLGDLKNFALEKSTNEFVIRWDADFIAYPEIVDLFEFCKSHTEYDGYILSGPNLGGDIFHSPKDKEFFGPECYLFRKDKSGFKKNELYADYPVFDRSTIFCYPQNTELNRNFFFLHTNSLKSIEKISFRKRMSEYHLDGEDVGYWVWMEKISGDENVKEKEIQRTLNSEVYLTDFDFNKWGEHPKILSDSPSSSIFKIKNTNGKNFLDYPIY